MAVIMRRRFGQAGRSPLLSPSCRHIATANATCPVRMIADAALCNRHAELRASGCDKAACRGPWARVVKISTPFSVTPTVCSNCADSERSRVTAVQPSDSTFTCGRPRLIIGSTVKNMPGRSTMPSPGRPTWTMFGSSWNSRPRPWPQKSRTTLMCCASTIGLDRGADVAGGGAGPDRGDAAHHRLVGHLDQPLGAARNFADRDTCGWNRRASRRGSA